MKKDVWISPAESGWKVQRAGSDRASSVHRTQEAAISEGRALAQKGRVELLIQSGDGRIRERNSYGNDPRKSKG